MEALSKLKLNLLFMKSYSNYLLQDSIHNIVNDI